MVKKLLLIFSTILLFSSCAFFGSSLFPMAISQDISFMVMNGNVRAFYILNNGLGDELLFLVSENMGQIRVAIFDTALNLRGYMEDGNNGVVTDGVGFVDHNGDFVIGATNIGKIGDTDNHTPVNVQGVYNNVSVFRYTDTASTNYYMRIDFGGYIERLDGSWLLPVGQSITAPPPFIIINQSNPDLGDIVFAEQNGNIYVIDKSVIYDHAMSITPPIALDTPTLSITDISLTQWVTRCDRGYFVSSIEGDYILYSNTGDRIGTVDNKEYYGEIVTIDYDSDYYYVIDQNKGIIRKERLPF